MTALAPRTRLMLHGPILPVLVRLAIPNLLLVLVQTSVGLIEMFWVARLGTEALAGVALVFPVVMLMTMMSGGAVGGGISSSIARAIGGGRIAVATMLAYHALVICGVLGLVCAALVLSLGRSIYMAMGGEGASLQAALAYSNIVFAGIVLLWLLNALASILRGSGNIAFPAAVVCIGAAALAILSPVLIFGIGPLPPLGVKGAALAVVLYYASGSLVLAARLASGHELVKLTLRGIRFQWHLVTDILKVGAISAPDQHLDDPDRRLDQRGDRPGRVYRDRRLRDRIAPRIPDHQHHLRARRPGGGDGRHLHRRRRPSARPSHRLVGCGHRRSHCGIDRRGLRHLAGAMDRLVQP